MFEDFLGGLANLFGFGGGAELSAVDFLDPELLTLGGSATFNPAELLSDLGLNLSGFEPTTDSILAESLNRDFTDIPVQFGDRTFLMDPTDFSIRGVGEPLSGGAGFRFPGFDRAFDPRMSSADLARLAGGGSQAGGRSSVAIGLPSASPAQAANVPRLAVPPASSPLPRDEFTPMTLPAPARASDEPHGLAQIFAEALRARSDPFAETRARLGSGR